MHSAARRAWLAGRASCSCPRSLAVQRGLCRLIQEGLQLADVQAAFPHPSQPPVPFSWRFLAYVELTLPVLYAVFIVSVGLSVVLWLHRRFRREG